jgi:CYTH domain-containing protein
MGVEIERKFTVKELPADLEKYPCHIIEQGYLNITPAIRVRREDDTYYMTYKGKKGGAQAIEAQNSIQKLSTAANSTTQKAATAVQNVAQKLSTAAKSTAASGADAPIGQTEYNLPLDKASYDHLIAKADGIIIRKKRYILPVNEDAFSQSASQAGGKAGNGPINILAGALLKIELDVFDEPYKGTIIAEVEFPTEEAAKAYIPADWFDKDVTGDVRYSNANMSGRTL